MKSGPIVRNPGLMDPRIFRDDLMQLEETLLSVGLAQRVSFDADRNTLFLDLEGVHIKTRDDADRVRGAVEEKAQEVRQEIRAGGELHRFPDRCSVTTSCSSASPMSRRDLIRGPAPRKAATAIPATLATDHAPSLSTVAGIATVAVANRSRTDRSRADADGEAWDADDWRTFYDERAGDRACRFIEEAFAIRNHPQWQAMRDCLASGEIGELRSVQATLAYNNTNPADIRNRADVGGGALYDIGSYAIAGCRLIFGDEPVRVIAAMDRDRTLHITIG